MEPKHTYHCVFQFLVSVLTSCIEEVNPVGPRQTTAERSSFGDNFTQWLARNERKVERLILGSVNIEIFRG